MKVWPFVAALAEGGCKPPHAALAEDRRGERCGKGARDASGGDREDGAQSPIFWGSLWTCRNSIKWHQNRGVVGQPGMSLAGVRVSGQAVSGM